MRRSFLLDIRLEGEFPMSERQVGVGERGANAILPFLPKKKCSALVFSKYVYSSALHSY
jgi:hypothetical protein